MKLFLNHIISPTQAAFLPSRRTTDNTILCKKFFTSSIPLILENITLFLNQTQRKLLINQNGPLLGLPLSFSIFLFILLIQSWPFYPYPWSFYSLFLLLLISTLAKVLGKETDISLHIHYLYEIPFFSLLISEAVKNNSQSPIRISKNGLPISHLFFADDIILFAKTETKTIAIISKILSIFSNLSGQKISQSKSKVYCSKNTSANLKTYLLTSFNIPISHTLGVYLGFPLSSTKLNPSSFTFLLDKVKAKLHAWEHKYLSLPGRATLIKTTLSSLPFISSTCLSSLMSIPLITLINFLEIFFGGYVRKKQNASYQLESCVIHTIKEALIFPILPSEISLYSCHQHGESIIQIKTPYGHLLSNINIINKIKLVTTTTRLKVHLQHGEVLSQVGPSAREGLLFLLEMVELPTFGKTSDVPLLRYKLQLKAPSLKMH